MFPYLRTGREYISDCETSNYKIVKSDNAYKIEKLSSAQESKYCSDKDIELENLSNLPCRDCTEMPRLVGWLAKRVDDANWGPDKGANGVGSVGFAEIAAWCQSLCLHLKDVLLNVDEKVLDNICVGLEYYLENHFELDNNRARVDMMIGGYGSSGEDNSKLSMKLMVIELKSNRSSSKTAKEPSLT